MNLKKKKSKAELLRNDQLIFTGEFTCIHETGQYLIFNRALLFPIVLSLSHHYQFYSFITLGEANLFLHTAWLFQQKFCAQLSTHRNHTEWQHTKNRLWTLTNRESRVGEINPHFTLILYGPRTFLFIFFKLKWALTKWLSYNGYNR